MSFKLEPVKLLPAPIAPIVQTVLDYKLRDGAIEGAVATIGLVALAVLSKFPKANSIHEPLLWIVALVSPKVALVKISVMVRTAIIGRMGGEKIFGTLVGYLISTEYCHEAIQSLFNYIKERIENKITRDR